MKIIAAVAATVAATVVHAITALPAFADETPRIAVMSAFEPEWTSLQADLENAERTTVNGTEFVTGTLSGQDVVLFLSGVSMVNAAMTTQAALDRFDISAIVFSGIAGGIDPSLNIGDVVVAEDWGNWLEGAMARETADGFALPGFLTSPFPNKGMIFTRETTVASDRGAPETRFWFPADPALLDAARKVAETTPLAPCNAANVCLREAPQVRVGGKAVSGSSFMDNADLRGWIFDTFDAQVVDMESAAVAQVAWANEVPFIAFRSLSDLAGGGEGENEMGVFMSLASDNSAKLVKAFLAELPKP